MLQGDRRRLELAYSLMMTLPGTPVVRYGDEIGMGDNLRLPERQCARTPMQWSVERQGGFTSSDHPVMPLVSEGPYGYQHVSVAEQRRDPNSMLNWMERIIRMRKELPEIGWGDFSVLRTSSAKALALRYDWRNNSVVVVHNLSAVPCEVWFKPNNEEEGDNNGWLINVLSNEHSKVQESGKHCILLEPYGYRWYRLGGMDYVQRRSDV